MSDLSHISMGGFYKTGSALGLLIFVLPLLGRCNFTVTTTQVLPMNISAENQTDFPLSENVSVTSNESDSCLFGLFTRCSNGECKFLYFGTTCEDECPLFEKKCPDGRCISYHQDCYDGGNGSTCPYAHQTLCNGVCTGEDTFECKNFGLVGTHGGCFTQSQKCDGRHHCISGRDEKYCRSNKKSGRSGGYVVAIVVIIGMCATMASCWRCYVRYKYNRTAVNGRVVRAGFNTGISNPNPVPPLGGHGHGGISYTGTHMQPLNPQYPPPAYHTQPPHPPEHTRQQLPPVMYPPQTQPFDSFHPEGPNPLRPLYWEIRPQGDGMPPMHEPPSYTEATTARYMQYLPTIDRRDSLVSDNTGNNNIGQNTKMMTTHIK